MCLPLVTPARDSGSGRPYPHRFEEGSLGEVAGVVVVVDDGGGGTGSGPANTVVIRSLWMAAMLPRSRCGRSTSDLWFL